MSIGFRISMFYLSFIPLWITVLFVDIKSIIIGGGNKWTELLSVVLIAVAYVISSREMKNRFNNSAKIECEYHIAMATENKVVTPEFLLSYVLPLFAFDFRLWDETFEFLIFFAILLFLSVRHNYVTSNLLLEIKGYKIFKCIMINRNQKLVEKTLISKDELTMHKGHRPYVDELNQEYMIATIEHLNDIDDEF